MKKFIITTAVLSLFSSVATAQEKSTDFDKKFRFGLRVNPQPTWFISGEKSNQPSGAKFGVGFGLNMERRFSDIVGVMFGIGADFEGGKYNFNHDPSNTYVPTYWMDESEGIIVAPDESKKNKFNQYELKSRTVKTTYVTVPVLLKLSTNEYNGFKYFGLFGLELAYLAKALGEDTYYKVSTYRNDSLKVLSGEASLSDIDIKKDFSKIPIRLGFNAGLGAEYRLGGSTSAFISVNFFQSLTNQMRKESDYVYYRTGADGKRSYLAQDLKTRAIRINIGIMF